MTDRLAGERFTAGGIAAAILDSTNALVVTLDVHGRITSFNRACELLTGYDAAEVIGTPIWERLIPEGSIDSAKALFDGLRQGSEVPEEMETPWLTRDGHRPTISWNNSLLRDPLGRVEQVVAIGVDVTERNAAADRLARAQRIAGIGSWEWTISTNEECWSDQFFINLGLKPGSVAPSVETFYRFVHPDDREWLQRRVQLSVDQRLSYSADFRIIRADGAERLIHEEAEMILDASGQPGLLAGTMQDVTDLRRTEDDLQRMTQRLSGAQRIARIGNWDWDAATDKEWWSDEIFRIMGIVPGSREASFENFLDRTHPEDRVKVTAAIESAEKSHTEYNIVYRILRPDGEIRLVRETGECIFGADGEFKGLSGTVQDVTEQHAAEREMVETTQRLTAAMRLAQLGSWEWTPDTNLLSMSEETLAICGLGPHHAVVDNGFLMAMIPVEEHERVLACMDRAVAGGGVYTNEYHIRRPDGDLRHVLEHGNAVRDETTGTTRLLGTIQDITERKRTEEALLENEARLRSLFNNAPVGIGLADKRGHMLEVNGRFAAFLGYAPDELIGLTYRDFSHPDNIEDSRKQIDDLLAGKAEAASMEKQYIRADQTTAWGNRTLSLIRDDTGAPKYLVVIVEDIDHRKQAEAELAKAVRRLEEGQRIAHLGHWEWRPGTTDTVWSDEIYRIFGLMPGEIRSTHDSFFAMVHEDDRESIRQIMDRTIETGAPYETEFRIRRRDGEQRHIFERAERYIDGETGMASIRGVMLDITERKAMEEELRETADTLEKTQSIAKIGSWVWDRTEDREWWSDEVYRIFGLNVGKPAMSGYSFLEYVHPADREHVDKVMRDAVETSSAFTVEYRVESPAGATRVVHEQGEPILDSGSPPRLWRGAIQDITERKRIEEELARLNEDLERRVEDRTEKLRAAQVELVKSERLATLGQLTATVSHELRNPLGAMRTSMYVVEKKLAETDDRLLGAIARINRNITRCDQIIDELLDFTRIRDLELQPVDLNAWLSAAIEEQTVPEGILVRQEFVESGIRVSVDGDRLHRAFVNVFENACQALAENRETAAGAGQPELKISTRSVAGRVEIRVSDNGPGVPPDIREKIFEPLFSTKSFGVGLGLPTVMQIMQQHGGGVEIGESAAGGAEFALWLPMGGEMGTADI